MRKKFALAFLTCVAVAFLSTAAFAQVSWSDVQTSTDEALLMKAIDQPGDSPEAIHNVNVACKRLAVYGTPKSIPALVALLPVEKQNFNARFALEAMPFDEVDAALDEGNVGRFSNALLDFIPNTQFLLVTHSKKTMSLAKAIYGVTMEDSGVSKILSVHFDDVGEDGEILIRADSKRDGASKDIGNVAV